MTVRQACPEAPGPLEAYARQFDACFGSLAQRRAFRAYLQGLLLPRDRNKTLTALAGTAPVVGAQHPAAQQLQYFLSEAAWEAPAVNARRLELLLTDPATAPACWSSTTPATGRPGTTPPTSGGSTWAPWGRRTTGSWR